MNTNEPKKSEPSKITVAGITFCADEVVSAVLKVDGREIYIQKKDEPEKTFGFQPNKTP